MLRRDSAGWNPQLKLFTPHLPHLFHPGDAAVFSEDSCKQRSTAKKTHHANSFFRGNQIDSQVDAELIISYHLLKFKFTAQSSSEDFMFRPDVTSYDPGYEHSLEHMIYVQRLVSASDEDEQPDYSPQPTMKKGAFRTQTAPDKKAG